MPTHCITWPALFLEFSGFADLPEALAGVLEWETHLSRM
jgi:hypothetical protein